MAEKEKDPDKERASEKAFIDAGFTVEKLGSITVYRRPVSDDVLEASMYFARKRTIGYTSKDIPRRKDTRRD